MVPALLTAVSACGGTPTEGSARLRVLMAEDWGAAPAVLDAVKEFERARPGVRVELQKVLFELMADTVREGVRRGAPPDVIQWHAFAGGAQGLAEPLDELWRTSLVEKDFIPGSVEDVSWGGGRYGVPLDTNAMLLLYDPEVVSQAGISQPLQVLTFSELREVARRLTSADGSRRAIGIPSSTWHTYGWIRANGGEVVEVGPDGTPRFTFDRREVIEALAFLGDLVRGGVAFPPTGISGDRIDAFDLFRTGTAALHASGSWDLAALQRQRRPSGVALMPRGALGTTQGTVMGGSSLFVGKGSRNRALAVAFMRHLTSERYELRLAEEEGRLPVRQRVYENRLFDNPEMQTFLVQLQSANPFKLEAFPVAHKAFEKALDDVLLGHRDAASALQEAQKKAQESVGGAA